jgi:protein involved in polysaccharide export with SLBB domain
MAFVERMRNVLVVSPEKCGRWYGASCAMIGAAIASIVWTFAVGFSHLADDSPASSDMAAIIDSDGQPAETPPPELCDGLTEEFLLGAGVHCATGEPAMLGTYPFLEDSFRPLHQREGYRVEAPDILEIDIQAHETSRESMSGKYLVNADGAIELGGGIGSVTVAGMTIEEVQSAIARRLEGGDDAPRVCASVLAQYSHVYYVIHKASECEGDQVCRIPVIGNETVLDAVSQINNLGDLDDKHIWIARPQAGVHSDTILPVQWREISSDPASAANYKILSGDRIFVGDDTSDALETAIGQWIEPFRQLLGLEQSTTDQNCPCQENGCEEECCAQDEY